MIQLTDFMEAIVEHIIPTPRQIVFVLLLNVVCIPETHKTKKTTNNTNPSKKNETSLLWVKHYYLLCRFKIV
jgi:hypothetical protein